MKKIDFEAHFYTQEYVDALHQNKGFPRFTTDEGTKARRLWYNQDIGQPFADFLLRALLDLGEERVARMDKCGIEVQVLSLSAPGIEQLDPATGATLAHNANNILYEIANKFPGRFMGYAALAPKNPEKAADELERCVTELGFKGWNTHSNYGDSHLDDRRYWPILERAERLKVPVYLHPAVPDTRETKGYGFALAGTPFGFGLDTALCMMRLIYGGVFDAYPSLRIVLGHLGEGLPFFLSSMDRPYVKQTDPGDRPNLSRKPSEYFKNNVFITTSGNYYAPAFTCAYEALGIDRVLLGTDYPYEEPEECLEFLEGLPLSQDDKNKVYSTNARQLGIAD